MSTDADGKPASTTAPITEHGPSSAPTGTGSASPGLPLPSPENVPESGSDPGSVHSATQNEPPIPDPTPDSKHLRRSASPEPSDSLVSELPMTEPARVSPPLSSTNPEHEPPRQVAGVKRRASQSTAPISSIPASSASLLTTIAASAPAVTMPSASMVSTSAVATAAAAVAAAAAAANINPSSSGRPGHHIPTSSTSTGAVHAGIPGMSLAASLQSLPALSHLPVNGLGMNTHPDSAHPSNGSASPGMVGLNIMTSSMPGSGPSPRPVPKLQKTSRDFSQSVRKKLNSSSRTGQACDRCKVRKIRCDATPGGCTQCRQNNTPCRTTDRITGRATTRGYPDRLESENQALRARLAEREQQLRDLGHDCHSSDLLNSPHHPLGASIGVAVHGSPSSPSPQTSTADMQTPSPFQHNIFQAPDMWSSTSSSALLSVSAYNNALDATMNSKRSGPASRSYEMHSQSSQHSASEQSQPSHHEQQSQSSHSAEHQAEERNGGSNQGKLKSLPFFGQAFEVPGMNMVAAEAADENQPPTPQQHLQPQADMMDTA